MVQLVLNPLIVVFVSISLIGCDRHSDVVIRELDEDNEVVIPVPDMEVTQPSVDFESSFDMTVPVGRVAESWNEWIVGFDRVDVVVYDYRAEEGALVQGGRLHKGVLGNLTETLDASEVDRLEELVTGSRTKELGAWCYLPHHGFIFYDAANAVVGHIEVCLMCRNYRSYPRSTDHSGLSSNWDLKGIKKFLKDKGLPVFDKKEEWEEFFEKQ